MFRRAVTSLTLIAFSLTSVSCVYYTHVPTSPGQLAQGSRTIHARAILTKSGGLIEFSGIVAARVESGQIVVTGTGGQSKGNTVRIAEADLVRAVSPNAGGISGIPTRDGVQFSGDIVTRKDGTITLAFTEVVVPMSAVDHVLVERLQGNKLLLASTVAGFGLTVAALFALVAITWNSW